MNRREFIIVASATLGLAVATACGSSSNENIETPPASVTSNAGGEPLALDWAIGAAGDPGEGAALLASFDWEPANLQAPVNQPFRIRFVPRDSLRHPITFIGSLKDDAGFDVPDVIVEGNIASQSEVMTLKSSGQSFRVFCREHQGRGCAGYINT